MPSNKLPSGLYVIADPRFLPRDVALLAYVEQLAQAGVPTIQLRMKDTADAVVLATARTVAAIRERYPFYFVVNDHPHVARAVGADAVHVGKTDLTLSHVRDIVGPEIAIGYSSHAVCEAIAAQKNGADYLAFGAIFSTATKGPGHPVQGPEKLQEIVRVVDRPLVAIGGIARANIEDVWATGVRAIAMITGISQATDVAQEVEFYATVCRRDAGHPAVVCHPERSEGSKT